MNCINILLVICDRVYKKNPSEVVDPLTVDTEGTATVLHVRVMVTVAVGVMKCLSIYWLPWKLFQPRKQWGYYHL